MFPGSRPIHRPRSLLYHQGIPPPESPLPASPLPAGYVPPRQAAQPPAQPPPRTRAQRRGRRKKGGCVWGCLSVALVLILAAGGLFLWRRLPLRSDALVLGKRQSVLTDDISPSGGALTVEQPGSAVNGLRITVPPGAYRDNRTFVVSVLPIEGHKLGPDFDPATPLIRIENGHAFSAQPMVVDIPIQIAEDEFALAFFYDRRSGKLEGIPTTALSRDRITVLTHHFSDLVVSRVKRARLEGLTVETGFLPGVDDWQFVNHGSYIAPGGHCAGQSLSAMWYYYEKRLAAGERPLYGRFDNNNYGFGTIDFQWDDSWGYRLASTVQKEQWDAGRGVLSYWGAISDSLTWYSFAYAMHLTGEPQYVSIGRYEADQQGKQVRRGHALIVYRIEGDTLWVADPNYPGQADRTIRFEKGGFLPYTSGESAAAIAANGARQYPEIRYMAKSALVNWSAIGAEYERMLKGEAGKAYFPAHIISYASGVDPTTGAWIWTELPDIVELDEDMTAKLGEPYRGKLVVGIGMNQAFAAAWFDGTTRREVVQSNAQHKATLEIPLTPGVLDLGIEIDNVKDGKDYFTDFKRAKVFYERPDLTGTWQGVYRIEESLNAQRYVEDGLAQVLLWTGLAEDEAEARQTAAEAIVQDPNLHRDRALQVELEAIDPDKGDRYRTHIWLEGDPGEVGEYSGEATLKEGVLTFDDQGRRWHDLYLYRGGLGQGRSGGHVLGHGLEGGQGCAVRFLGAGPAGALGQKPGFCEKTRFLCPSLLCKQGIDALFLVPQRAAALGLFQLFRVLADDVQQPGL